MKQRYDSYKPSGIDWIGDVPEHWVKSRIKYIVIFNSGDTITSEQFIDSGKYPVYGANGYRGQYDQYNFDHKRLLIGRVGALCGNVHYIDEKIWCSEHALISSETFGGLHFDYPWLAYMLKSMNLNQYGGGSAQPVIASSTIENLQIVVPPLPEQQAIAVWLDTQCGEIDSVIAKVDKEIELIDELKQSEISRVVTRGLNPDVPLRPSGIDWIGDVPEHWDKCRFKNFMYLKVNPSASERKVGLENLESGSGKYIETDTEFEGNGIAFTLGDILYGKLRPYLRKVWLAEFEGNAIGDFFVFRNHNNSNISFLKYLLLSDGFTKQADGSTFGAKMPRVSSEFILTLPFFLPPFSEQQAIADYLDKKCAEIDGLKEKLIKKRETLKELRQAIISEVVTGKRKVI